MQNKFSVSVIAGEGKAATIMSVILSASIGLAILLPVVTMIAAAWKFFQ